MPFLAPLIPFILPALSAASAIGGTFMAMQSAQQQGDAAQAQANYQAELARRDAQQARLNKNAEIEKGAVATQDKDFENLIAMEDTLAMQGASGFDTGSGSFRTKRRENQILAGLDRQRITADYENRGKQYEMNARALEDQASFEVARGQSAQNAAKINKYSTLITGAGETAKSFSNYSDAWGLT